MTDQPEPVHRKWLAECRAILAAIRAGHTTTDQPRTDGPITRHSQPPTTEDQDP